LLVVFHTQFITSWKWWGKGLKLLHLILLFVVFSAFFGLINSIINDRLEAIQVMLQGEIRSGVETVKTIIVERECEKQPTTTATPTNPQKTTTNDSTSPFVIGDEDFSDFPDFDDTQDPPTFDGTQDDQDDRMELFYV